MCVFVTHIALSNCTYTFFKGTLLVYFKLNCRVFAGGGGGWGGGGTFYCVFLFSVFLFVLLLFSICWPESVYIICACTSTKFVNINEFD